ncbi:DNA repair protein RecN [Demequina sediminicola]|uniref:DNA repair protein RecN n=1 Tax=Demequina sediminicola TaxID=1095026 RepID=UPI0007820799|nr:DNA repair protein RecN [Demequina sediminicola]
MLHELSIADLGVIESSRIALGPGLTCVTGETGAGKTMVLTGLGLILGAKGVKATVREGAPEALAEAVLDIPRDSEASARLHDAGVMIEDDGTVVVARTVGAETRSRTVVGGRTVPSALLADLASSLVTVHGQSDQVRLRSSARQRATLDEYGGEQHSRVLASYTDAWLAWNEARAELAEMEAGAEAQRAEVLRLRDDVAAIDDIAPQPGEDAALEAQVRLLENGENVRVGVAAAHEGLTGDHDAAAVTTLEAARRSLADAAQHDDTLQELEQRLASFVYGATDVATELAMYIDGMESEPGRLNEVHERRSDISALLRRIGVANLDALLSYADDARVRIEADDNWDETLATRRERERETRDALEALAGQLHQSRVSAAQSLGGAVDEELAQLAMPDAEMKVRVEYTEPMAHGADNVTFTLAAHPGVQHRPIADAASGGELSRIMLALEVALSDVASETPHTFVFDEVDAGVGGRAAIAVGSRLAALARHHQVIVVTHLAQVAAFADAHVVVSKATDGSITRTDVSAIDGERRIEEVARLLSGQDSSSTARAHAVELLEASRVAR